MCHTVSNSVTWALPTYVRTYIAQAGTVWHFFTIIKIFSSEMVWVKVYHDLQIWKWLEK